MRYKKILLINPPYTGARVKVVFCAGLGYIAESLEKNSFEYDVLDMSLGYSYNDLRQRLDDFCPDLIGVSVMTYRYKETYALINQIKKDYPKVDIIVGGAHVSLFREEMVRDCSGIDYAAILEGEETIVELCKGNELSAIKGLIFRKQDQLIYNGDRDFIKDLDSIPFPRYKKFELEKSFNKQISALPIVSSRGCPFNCIYCPVKCSIGQNFRMRSPESIIEELTFWYDMGFRRFSFADDNFTLVKQRVYDLCQLLKKSNLKEIILRCDNGIRADKVDKELLSLMKEVGFRRVAIGVEAGNDKVLKMIKKSESIETIKRAIGDACELGYEVNLFFLVGSPGETLDDLSDSFKIALDYPIGTAFFYNIIPFPHTELFEWIKENGRLLEPPEQYLDFYPILDNYPVFETADMSAKQRKKALSLAFAMTRKTMRKNWQRRLSGLGFFGRLLAFIYTSRLMQDVILRNKFLNGIAYKIARVLISKR